jgi:hypothetical protein
VLALSLACLALVALLAYREQGHRRDRASWHAIFDHLAEKREAERQEAAGERRELYQRIQAPEIAVAEAHRERRGPYTPRKPIGADDDAAFAARGSAEVSDV